MEDKSFEVYCSLFFDDGVQENLLMDSFDFEWLIKMAERVISYNTEHDIMSTGYLTEDTKFLINRLKEIRKL